MSSAAIALSVTEVPLLVTLDQHRLTLSVHREGAGGPIRVGVDDELHELRPGDTETFALTAPVAAGGRPRGD